MGSPPRGDDQIADEDAGPGGGAIGREAGDQGALPARGQRHRDLGRIRGDAEVAARDAAVRDERVGDAGDGGGGDGEVGAGDEGAGVHAEDAAVEVNERSGT